MILINVIIGDKTHWLEHQLDYVLLAHNKLLT